MADNTKIEWADATLNYVNGCSVVSPGCTNCYAMRLAGTRLKHHPSRAGLTRPSKAGPVWTGEVRRHEAALTQALAWKRGRRIFWNAHGDLFHDAVPDEWIDRLFAVCALTPQHTHMILTKRSARMREYFEGIPQPRWIRHMKGLARSFPRPEIVHPTSGGVLLETVNRALPNVWLGVSVEDQQRADERIPDLLATPAAVRFISGEPLLGPVDLTRVELVAKRSRSIRSGIHINTLAGQYVESGMSYIEAWDIDGPYPADAAQLKLDWVIVGGESGPGARPMHPDWARSLRDQCTAADVAFHFKQWGEWAPICAMSEEAIEACYHPAPESRPEAHRRRKVDQCVLHRDGQRFDGRAMFERPAFEQGSGAMTMMAIGKKCAGRLLDGVEHNGMPGHG